MSFTSQLLFLALALPLGWLLLYALLLALRLRVKESIPIYSMKALIGVLIPIYGYLVLSGEEISLMLQHWMHIPGEYEFPLEYYFTPALGVVALAMLLLLAVLVKYSESYLHKEVGFHRFFFLFAVFLYAFPLVVFADNIDVLFIGWELIGITSVLLINFYEHRPHTAQNAWWAISFYRASDVGLLAATALAHYAVHTTNIRELNQPVQLMAQHPHHAGWLGLAAFCLFFASLAKAAQLPFTSWITRAMEGPTPSSALYYGALSIGLGPVLLLKFQGLLLHFWWLQLLIVCVGGLTALYAFLVAKTRSDAKSILAFSAVFEVSMMVVEVGIGLHRWVLFHFVANAFLRVFQFLRSMNAIHDFYDNPLFYKGAPHRPPPLFFKLLSRKRQRQLYYLAMNGFGLDWFWLNVVARPWLALLNRINHIENRWALGERERPGDWR